MRVEGRFITIASFVGGLWLSWVISPFLFSLGGSDWKFERLGQWGDSFGVLSSLFSAAAFLGAVYAIQQQQQQITQARIEQERINIESSHEQHRQKFESSFFELLKLLRELRNEVKYEYLGEKLIDDVRKNYRYQYLGGEAFRVAWGQILRKTNEKSNAPDRSEMGRIYNDIIHNEHEESFSPYFRLLYTMLNRIKDDKILSEETKLNYARLLRSQLTSYELAIAGMNALSPISKDLSDLLVYFRMFKYVPPGYRLRTLKRYYPEEAFSPRD